MLYVSMYVYNYAFEKYRIFLLKISEQFSVFVPYTKLTTCWHDAYLKKKKKSVILAGL